MNNAFRWAGTIVLSFLLSSIAVATTNPQAGLRAFLIAGALGLVPTLTALKTTLDPTDTPPAPPKT